MATATCERCEKQESRHETRFRWGLCLGVIALGLTTSMFVQVMPILMAEHPCMRVEGKTLTQCIAPAYMVHREAMDDLIHGRPPGSRSTDQDNTYGRHIPGFALDCMRETGQSLAECSTPAVRADALVKAYQEEVIAAGH